jgi:hypothetical protein
MRVMKQTIMIFLFVNLGFINTLACQPVPISHYKYFRKAKAVFIGKVLDIKPNDGPDAEARRYFPYKIKFSVEKSWKGKATEITVISDANTSMCTAGEFKQGEKYLVYAFGKNLEVTTYIGNRTRLLGKALDEIERKEFEDLDSFWFRLKSTLWLF